MKTILFTATALSLTGAALANGNEWSALDREVETLASSLVDNHEGINFSGYADIWYTNDSDNDESGFGVNNARIMASGGTDGFGAYVEYQLAGGGDDFTFDNADDDVDPDPQPITVPGNDRLLDAYVTQDLGGMTLTMGRHKVVGNASSMEHERDMFFQTRSDIGYHYVGRDEGISLSGGDGFNWSVGIADGSDDNTDEYRFSAHGDMEVGGGLTAGLTYTQDGATDGDAIIVDVAYSMDAINVGLEYAMIGEDGLANTGSSDGSVIAGPNNFFVADSSPMAISVTYDLGGESAIGVRYQDGDENECEAIDIAYNYGMWGIQYSDAEGTQTGDSSRIIVGLQVGF